MLDGPPLLWIEAFKVGGCSWHGMVCPGTGKTDSVIPGAFARLKIAQRAAALLTYLFFPSF
jgi:hypothetical protein